MKFLFQLPSIIVNLPPNGAAGTCTVGAAYSPRRWFHVTLILVQVVIHIHNIAVHRASPYV